MIEHLQVDEARTVIGSYLPYLRPGGEVVFITPQERGYASDPTHVVFADYDELRRLSVDLGLTTTRQYSFPFPRSFGKFFIYNEFNHAAEAPIMTTHTTSTLWCSSEARAPGCAR